MSNVGEESPTLAHDSLDDGLTVLRRTSLRRKDMEALFSGSVAALIVNDFLATEDAAYLASAFVGSDQRLIRTGDAAGAFIGVFHYGKTFDEYRQELASQGDFLRNTIHQADGALDKWAKEFHLQFGSDMRLRPARWRNLEVCSGVMRAWQERQDFALQPHEDLSQCSDERQIGFDIQSGIDRFVFSLNICVSKGPGGALRLWNAIPTETYKAEHNLVPAGLPYPEHSLTGVPFIEIDIAVGDLYIFNSSLLHAVTPSDVSASPIAPRINIACLLRRVDERLIVQWA